MSENPGAAPSGLSASDLASVMSGENGAFVEALFEDYLAGRESVPETWTRLFDELTGGNGRSGSPALRLRWQPPSPAHSGSPSGARHTRPASSASSPRIAPTAT